MNKLVKIQSYVRGMEMRDQIKLKNKPKRLKSKDLLNSKKIEVNYENTFSRKIEETDVELQKKYDNIIVKNII